MRRAVNEAHARLQSSQQAAQSEARMLRSELDKANQIIEELRAHIARLEHRLTERAG